MKGKVKWIGGTACISVIVAAILVFSFREAILLEAGRFMAPQANHMDDVVDVVILEGAEFIGRGIVSKGVEILSSGKARRMVIVLHRLRRIIGPSPFMKITPLPLERSCKASV